ncbi:MAG TPA: (deoxy)nucleoside triphosphate pyrophosphohydrolase [Prolixibacteraceae bacterium]|nr:(deoxy)nucleoside triphosphate pyrophosphohydrolase [Prolixibacteraceae bacterium]
MDSLIFSTLQDQKVGYMIEVCCAIIIRGSEILAVQRGPESSHPWKWEFPGGKVHPKESAAQCIVREIEEELRIRIEILETLSSVEFDYGKGPIRLMPFVCKALSGEMILTEHVAHQWFLLNQWDGIDWQEADRDLILKNFEQLKGLLT